MLQMFYGNIDSIDEKILENFLRIYLFSKTAFFNFNQGYNPRRSEFRIRTTLSIGTLEILSRNYFKNHGKITFLVGKVNYFLMKK